MMLGWFSPDVARGLLDGVAGDVLEESTGPDKEVVISISVGVHHPEQPAPHLLISWRWRGGANHASTQERLLASAAASVSRISSSVIVPSSRAEVSISSTRALSVLGESGTLCPTSPGPLAARSKIS